VRAIVQERYGSPDALVVRDVPRPVVRDDEVLVRVRAASVHADVWHTVLGVPYVLRIMGGGLRRPKEPVPGIDVAGVVEAVGARAGRFRVGDEVFGETVKGMQWRNGGAYAEYVAAPEEALARKPSNLSFDEAAAVPTSALIALSGLRDQARLQPGQSVLVNGAGGGLGIFAVQLARALGASSVTAVDHTAKLDLLRSLGADRVIDYAAEDFTQGADRYDVILDIPGNHPFSSIRRALTPSGTYVLIGHDAYGAEGRRVFGSIPRFLKLVVRTPFTPQLPRLDFSPMDKAAAMTLLAELIEAGKLRPVIDRTFPLEQVPAAIRYLASGEATGKIVITVDHP
jgi:NADPH:quinone reductase-like Zn-dependent oxidoreductase